MTDLEVDIDTGMPLVSSEFLDVLRNIGVDENDIGWYAAEMDAAPEDDGIHAWQTYCNRLSYPENVPISTHQLQAGKEAQAFADAEIKRMVQEAELSKYIPHAEALPYNVLVDIWILGVGSRKKGESDDEIKAKIEDTVKQALERDLKKRQRRKRATSA